jgi:hypothetical protein
MKNNFDNKLTDIKKAEQDRRNEIVLLGLLIEKYPKAAANYLAALNQPDNLPLPLSYARAGEVVKRSPLANVLTAVQHTRGLNCSLLVLECEIYRSSTYTRA